MIAENGGNLYSLFLKNIHKLPYGKGGILLGVNVIAGNVVAGEDNKVRLNLINGSFYVILCKECMG